jgi:hypothetical protein
MIHNVSTRLMLILPAAALIAMVVGGIRTS